MEEYTEHITCGIIGLGLIGGSLARALKKYTTTRVIAYDPDSSTLARAKQLKVIDDATDMIGPAFTRCDIVFLCAPASLNLFNLRIVAPFLRTNATLSDVSSVKTPIHNLAKELGLIRRFIGGHPMAGSERSGFQSAKASLFKDASFVLTATSETDTGKLGQLYTLISALGARPILLTPTEHDRLVAAVSHLPHVAAAALVHTVRETDHQEDLMQVIAAGGFKDITRIASSSPELWRQICTLNKEALSVTLADYIKRLNDVKAQIDRADANALAAFFAEAKAYRGTFPDR